MGQGISNLVLVNRTAAVFKATAQLVTINPDTPIGDTVEQEVQPHGTDTLVLTRNQKFDVRVNILFKSSDGATAKIRLNVPPKVITRTIEITESMVFVDGNPSGAVVAANIGYPAASPQEDPSPPVYTEVAEHLKPMAPVANAVAVPADVLLPNTKVMFRSRSSGKFLRIIDGGLVDAKGNHDNYSKFIVDPSPRGYLRLRNVHNGERFLALRGGQATSGRGDKFCELIAMQVNDSYALRTVDDSEGFGFNQDGDALPSLDATYCTDGLFAVDFP